MVECYRASEVQWRQRNLVDTRMRSGTPTAVRFSDDHGAVLVRERADTSLSEADKIISGTQSFCELCWRQTECALAAGGAKRYNRKRGGAVDVVDDPIPNAETAGLASQILDVFLFALDGELHPDADKLSDQVGASDWGDVEPPYLAPRMVMWIGMSHFVDVRDRFKDFFHGENGGPAKGRAEAHPGLTDALCALIEDAIVRRRKAPADLSEKPSTRLSQRFCQLHNQRRGGESSRLYKRDHARKAELAAELANAGSRLLNEEFFVARIGDLDAIARIRKEAYYAVHRKELAPKQERPSVKNGQTIQAIKVLQSRGVASQVEIARQLGISRAAVSIALKRDRAEAAMLSAGGTDAGESAHASDHIEQA